MKYDPDIHHRQSIRLKGYDYSRAGLYFITICAQHRECLFGDIKGGEMQLNPAGHMVAHWFVELMNKFTTLRCDQFICMPNHVHFIIEITPGQTDLASPAETNLSTVLQWYKTMTTNAYIRGVKQDGWQPFPGKLWQRNYWDHIIRNDQSLQKIRQYIETNPQTWAEDQLNPQPTNVGAHLCVRPDHHPRHQNPDHHTRQITGGIVLPDHGYPPVDRDEVYKEIFEQAENFKKNRWL
jgi:REP element-mobilizing transposase RayT